MNVLVTGGASNAYTGVCAIFSSRLLNDQAPTIFEDGEQSRDFVHVSGDIVQANLLALETDGGDYQAMNIGAGRATSIGRSPSYRESPRQKHQARRSSANTAKATYAIVSRIFLRQGNCSAMNRKSR